MTPLTSSELAELERLVGLLAPMLPVRVNAARMNFIVTNQAHPFLEVSEPFHRQVVGGSGGDAPDLVTILNALPRLIAEVRELRAWKETAGERLQELVDWFDSASVPFDVDWQIYIAGARLHFETLRASEQRMREALCQAALELDEASKIIGGNVGPAAASIFLLASERAAALSRPASEEQKETP